MAVWHRDPPADTICTPLVLDTQDRALAHGWLYARGGESTVAVLMHPRADFSHHYVTPGLLDAGIAVLAVNSRWLNNDATLIHEQVLLDVAAGLAAARERFDRVVLVGNSGGASLFTFYLHQADAPAGGRLTHTAAGDPFDLNRFELPGADAMAYLAGHAGEGHYLLHAIDPSVTDEDDPVSCDPELDLYDPANGFVEPPDEPRYASDFLDRYRAAQRARVERIDARARELVADRRAGRTAWADGGTVADRRRAIATHFLHVYRTDADPRAVDRSLDPSERDYGSIWGRRPDWINYGAVGFGRVVSPEAWLSTWSGLSSQAEIAVTGARMTLPSLQVVYSGDNCIYPSDDALIASSIASPAFERVTVPGDHYGFPAETGREEATRVLADWITASPGPSRS
ncbi:MAG: alpha/beta hydrolase [Acidimicrobiia bacterium]